MDSQTYWKNRETEQRKHNIRDEAEYQKRIREIYQNMIDEIEKEINGFYGKYASKEGITLAEAKKRAAKADIEALGRKAAKYVKEKNFSQQANDEMRLYNMTMKVNRLELLKAQIGLEMVAGFDEMEKYFGEILTERAVSEFERQAGILGMTIQNNAKAANAIVNASFHNATYSDRIWMYQDMLKNELSSLLQTGLIQGQNPRRLATHLRKRFGVSQSNAERLMITELARVQTEAQKQSFERNGFEEYAFLALGDACPICKALDEKHFKVEKMMPGTNAPPMHPRCRCSVAAYEDSEDYEAWLDFLDKGGTTEEWNQIKSAKSDSAFQARVRQRREAYTRRKQRNQSKITNVFGDEIAFSEKMSDPRWKESKDMILKLTEQYKTRLRTVSPGSHQAAGTLDMGGNMRLNSIRVSDAIHEFAHSISMNDLTRYKVVDDSEFWKEIRKIRTNYRKAVENDTSRWISSYEHSSKYIDEFFAEAFTHAKLKEMGSDIPDKYGKDFTYSQQVLDVTNKYFGKSVAKGSGSGIIKSQKESVYEGIPRSWKKIEGPDDSLRAVNPNYSSRDKAYTTNCTNCVPAYEMRKRGYNVTARPTTKNHYLSRHPEEAWIDAKVKNTSGNGLDDIIDTIGKWTDGARAEVAITWKGSRNGHVIVAENVNGKIRFYDVQSGEKISSKLFSYVEEGKTTFWRIDNLELSDRGITACKAGD